jgi:hypothetical protein
LLKRRIIGTEDAHWFNGNIMKFLAQVITSLFLSAMTLSGWAQEIEHGFLNLANMVPHTKACKITIDGKDLMPGGLKSIQSTGWFIVPKGAHQLSVEIEGYKPAKGNVNIDPDETELYVIFLQQIGAKKDDEGNERPPEVRIKRCGPQPYQKGHKLQVMSFCPEAETFQIGSQEISLELFGVQDMPTWNGGAFNVMHKSKVIGGCPDTQEKGAYILLIGSNHKRTCEALLVRNEKQELPPWMKPKK